MKRVLLASLVALASILIVGEIASAQTRPEFKLGFKALADQILDVVGEPLENEAFNLSNGNSEQRTTKGLMVWRKADNWTAFTNGYMTWINGPAGVQSRINVDRFEWEKDPPAAQPAPAPVPAPPVQSTEWTVFDKSADGYKISLPPTWKQVDLNSQDIAAEFGRLVKEYPALASTADSRIAAATILKLAGGSFYGFPVDDRSVGSVVHVKILKAPAPSSATLDQLAKSTAAMLNQAAADGSFNSVAYRKVSLPAGDAVEFTYGQTVKLGLIPEIKASVVEYVFLRGGVLYDVVLVSTPEQIGEHKPLIEGMARSLQFTK